MGRPRYSEAPLFPDGAAKNRVAPGRAGRQIGLTTEDSAMTYLSLERLRQDSSAPGGAAAWLRTAWRAWKNRRAAAQLARLDDRLLADIGLRRDDVERALTAPPWQDPTLELGRIAAERRQAWRRR